MRGHRDSTLGRPKARFPHKNPLRDGEEKRKHCRNRCIPRCRARARQRSQRLRAHRGRSGPERPSAFPRIHSKTQILKAILNSTNCALNSCAAHPTAAPSLSTGYYWIVAKGETDALASCRDYRVMALEGGESALAVSKAAAEGINSAIAGPVSLVLSGIYISRGFKRPPPTRIRSTCEPLRR